MRPLSRVFWGLLVVFFDLRIDGFDLVPDVLGWALVLTGLGSLTAISRWFAAAGGAAVVAALLSLLQQFSEPSVALETVSGVLQTVVVFGTCSAILGVIGDHPVRGPLDALRWIDLGLMLVVLVAAVAVGFRRVETIWAVPLAIVGLGVFVWFLLVLLSLRDHPRLGGESVSA